MDLELTDKVAFVAGASRGIGRAIAEGFLREGARVALTARGADDLEAARGAFADAYGADRVHAIAGDQTSESEVARAFAEAEDRLGPVDAVVANVGTGRSVPGHDVVAEEWRRMMDINFVGSMAVAREALARLTDRGSGSLTFVSSIAGVESIPAPVTYSAAKAALISAMKNFARLVGDRGVRVNAVAPGNIYFEGGTWDRLLSERRAHFEAYIAAEVAMQRLGRPEEIADAVVFMASARASFMTGSTLVVDGGQTRAY